MNIKWDAEEYQKNFDFVPKYGTALLDMIEHKQGIVLDLGCGNGNLTYELYKRGYKVLGMDASENMLDLANKNYPMIPFIHGDATTFILDEKADVIFSNAVFHWIQEQDKLIKNLYANLKEHGELIFEFGGFGCAETVHLALEKIFKEYHLTYKRDFYFPTIGEYAGLLEANGFTVKYATLFDRPTKQNGTEGLKNWILMFDKTPFESIDDSLKMEIIEKAEHLLKDVLYINGDWYIDYVRIRMRAIK